MSLKQGQLIHYFESWAYFFAMNNPFVELPDVRLKKKCLILFAKRNELGSQNNVSLS